MGPENGEVAECSGRKLFEWKFQHPLKNITSFVNSSLTTNSGRRTTGQTEEHLQEWEGICKREITHPGWRSCLLWADPGILVARGSSDSRHRIITISAMPLKPLKIDKFSMYFIGEFPKSGEAFPLTSWIYNKGLVPCEVTWGRRKDLGSTWAGVSNHGCCISSKTPVEMGLSVNTCKIPPKNCPPVSPKI